MFSQLSKSKIFLYSCIVFIIGIAIASFLPERILEYDIYYFTCWVSFLVLLILFWKNKKLRFIALFGAVLFLAFWRYSISFIPATPDKIWYYNGQVVTLEGVVSGEPDIRQNNVKLEVTLLRLGFGGQGSEKLESINQSVDGKILVTTNLYPEYNYGDRLEITCELQAPEQFQGFAYDRYLARFDIYSVCYYPRIELLSSDRGNFIYEKIFKLKNKFRKIINYSLGEPEASLGRAITLGDKRGISSNLREIFSKAGISHIVAISGMHISILSAGVMYLLLGLGLSRKYSFYFASIFLVFYIIMIGAPASAIRAGLMGFLVLLALNIGRLNKITNSLFFVATLLLLINPSLLRDDIGFQLSFLAVAGIVYFFPILESAFEKMKIPKFKGVRSILLVTISAQITTLPIIIHNFSIVSVISPVSNLLVLWCLPFLMVFIIMGIVLSLILPSLGVVLFLPARLILKYIVWISELLIQIPYSFLEVSYIWPGWFWLYYIFLFWLVIKLSRKNKNGII